MLLLGWGREGADDGLQRLNIEENEGMSGADVAGDNMYEIVCVVGFSRVPLRRKYTDRSCGYCCTYCVYCCAHCLFRGAVHAVSPGSIQHLVVLRVEERGGC